jgi:hypothetical protein
MLIEFERNGKSPKQPGPNILEWRAALAWAECLVDQDTVGSVVKIREATVATAVEFMEMAEDMEVLPQAFKTQERAPEVEGIDLKSTTNTTKEQLLQQVEGKRTVQHELDENEARRNPRLPRKRNPRSIFSILVKRKNHQLNLLQMGRNRLLSTILEHYNLEELTTMTLTTFNRRVHKPRQQSQIMQAYQNRPLHLPRLPRHNLLPLNQYQVRRVPT